MPSLEEQAAVIESQVMTWVEKDQAAIDVSNTDKGRWNCARLAVRLNDELDGELSKQAVWMAVAGIYDRTRRCKRRQGNPDSLIQSQIKNVHVRISAH